MRFETNKISTERQQQIQEWLAKAESTKFCHELKRACTMLATFIPYATVSQLLERIFGLNVSDSTIWNWVQEMGSAIIQGNSQEVFESSFGKEFPEEIPAELLSLETIFGADGVMVPMRAEKGIIKKN